MGFFIPSGACFSNSYGIPDSSGALPLGSCCSPNSRSSSVIGPRSVSVESLGIRVNTASEGMNSIRAYSPGSTAGSTYVEQAGHQVDMLRIPSCSMLTGISACPLHTGHRLLRARPSIARACSMTATRS